MCIKRKPQAGQVGSKYRRKHQVEELIMAFETTEDILEQARGFLCQLSEGFNSLSNRTQQQRVKMLLDYVSQKKSHMEETLSRYKEQLPKKLLNARFQVLPRQEILNLCDEVTSVNQGDLTVDDVIAMVVKLDQCLIDLYTEAMEKTESKDVREIFKHLLEMGQRYQREWVRDAQEWKDL
jgi:rubrerythrin